MEIQDFSYLRDDLAKALTHKKEIWNDGLRQFSEENGIPLNELVNILQNYRDLKLIISIRRYIDDYTQILFLTFQMSLIKENK
jgi:hypothetical protein